MKICIRCKINQPTTKFARHTGHKDNLDGRCKQCINKAGVLRHKLRKVAPPMPDTCDCCNKPAKKTLCLDHDHETLKFRGWICEYCNRGIGQLGDTLSGVMNAVAYLQKEVV